MLKVAQVKQEKNGKTSFIIDTGAQYNPEICFSLFGEDKIAMIEGIQPGTEIEVSFNSLQENIMANIIIILTLGELIELLQL